MGLKVHSMLDAIAIIGARSGSKGLPNKNIALLGGRPLLCWVIHSAIECGAFSRVILSTDSDYYAEVGQKEGVEVPCLRPDAISKDHSSDFEYIQHMVNFLNITESYRPAIVTRICPTAPFQSPGDFQRLIRTLRNHPRADSAMLVAEARQNPAKALKIVGEGRNKVLAHYSDGPDDQIGPTARQSHTKAYYRSNSIATKIEAIENGSLVGQVSIPVITEKRIAIDIDDQTDLDFANFIVSKGCHK